MSPGHLVSLVAVVLAAGFLGAVGRRLPPVAATWVLTGAAVVAAVTVLSALATSVFEAVHGLPGVDHRVLWCMDGSPPTGGLARASGIGAALWCIVAGVRIRRRRVAYRALRDAGAQGPAVEVRAEGGPTAYSLPGHPGRIVVSRSMLASLLPQERAVLFAHERSHLANGHDRFIHLADLAAAVVPPFSLLASRVRYTTERWADEDAVSAVGDRTLVARAVARAALAQGDLRSPGFAALADHGVRRRVEALTTEPPSRRSTRAVAMGSVAFVAVLTGGSTVQVHHLATIVEHVCRLT